MVPTTGSVASQSGGGGSLNELSLEAQSTISPALETMVPMASDSGRTSTSNIAPDIAATAIFRLSQSHDCSRRITGQVATTIIDAQMIAPRKGDRIQIVNAISATMIRTPNVARGRSVGGDASRRSLVAAGNLPGPKGAAAKHTLLGMSPPMRLMAILAHPDDESLGVGGTLAKYAAEGVETFLVTATRGQQGRFRGHRDPPEHPGAERLGEIRERELRAAASVLGVTDVAVLDYQDKALDRADVREAVEAIAAHIRRVQPQVVVTFGPDGAYGHPDHIAISQFTSAAIVAAAASARAAHQVAKLYHIAWSAGTWELYQRAFTSVGCTVDGVERHAVPWPEWAITTVIDARPWWRTVWRAVSCHDTPDRQLRAVEEAVGCRPRDAVGASVLLPRVQHRQRRPRPRSGLVRGPAGRVGPRRNP